MLYPVCTGDSHHSPCKFAELTVLIGALCGINRNADLLVVLALGSANFLYQVLAHLDARLTIAVLNDIDRGMREDPTVVGTAPAIIKSVFDISKSAFKRALGRLMKEGKVVQEDGWTSLKK